MIKVACVGCGGIMQEHYRWLTQIEDVKLVGHCDVEKKLAEDGASRYGGQAFAEHEAMYDKVKPHAVYITVPPYAHGGMEEAAAERGIHLFIEKPIALERSVAKDMAKAIRQSKILCSVGYCFRYYDTVLQARQLLKGKAVSLIKGVWNGGMPGVWWWRRMDKSGGQIVEQTTHMFDLMIGLFGLPRRVFAKVGTLVQPFEVEDSSVIVMELVGGAQVAASFGWNSRTWRHELEVVGTEASVKWEPADTGKVVKIVGRDVEELDMPNADNVIGI